MQMHSFDSNKRGPRQDRRLGDCTPAEQALLAAVRGVGYGWLRDVPVAAGVAQTSGARVIRTHRFGKPDPRKARYPSAPESKLRDQQIELLELVSSLDNCRIKHIVIQDGLPVQAEVEE